MKLRSRHVHNILERKQITFLCFSLKKMANIMCQESFEWNPPRVPFVTCKQTPIDIFLWSISIRPLPFRFSSLRIHRLPPLFYFIDRKFYRETSAARLIFILFCFSVCSFLLFVCCYHYCRYLARRLLYLRVAWLRHVIAISRQPRLRLPRDMYLNNVLIMPSETIGKITVSQYSCLALDMGGGE